MDESNEDNHPNGDMKQTVIEDDVDGGEYDDINNGDENVDENEGEKDEEENEKEVKEAVCLKSVEAEKASEYTRAIRTFTSAPKKGIFNSIGVR
ncbi:uncharacterized protein MONOS_5223 [Monocercomonoides exilis]|uniref:uncharacterized protein n=1 Tax=Monocercomonoides exilis TaxID=2049356 RepID=UPI00355A0663|nr:hypothetical protein MONOS_5223 [Monocercomonoides exilis]|eukprot:MONOS_5223.1-p1 / transcript=MONOS_5223.1 / gene=MONOS_5223 / organism=Monocercomonoides_exilis_PA203 / gene_product=unspecified product / transcript_product=unspecified product / location=Mono_scaffold00149:80380-80661(+) / protein_length=94 / sequence_SO=supercontig / SO=protein_coding / is_pseudo=false